MNDLNRFQAKNVQSREGEKLRNRWPLGGKPGTASRILSEWKKKKKDKRGGSEPGNQKTPGQKVIQPLINENG